MSRQQSYELQQRCDSTEYELKHVDRNLHEAMQEKQAMDTRCSLLEERLSERMQELERSREELHEITESSKVRQHWCKLYQGLSLSSTLKKLCPLEHSLVCFSLFSKSKEIVFDQFNKNLNKCILPFKTVGNSMYSRQSIGIGREKGRIGTQCKVCKLISRGVFNYHQTIQFCYV